MHIDFCNIVDIRRNGQDVIASAIKRWKSSPDIQYILNMLWSYSKLNILLTLNKE